MAYQGGQFSWFNPPTDAMEHIQELLHYWQKEEAAEKLLLIAKHIDDPMKIRELEEEWLYGQSKSKHGSETLAARIKRKYGWDWD